ncbi:MAG: hypothetical protein HRU28_13825 [Rhizobiales bacterium]|nr:hypothetical protein [Hyphomicrobiales bacterium]
MGYDTRIVKAQSRESGRKSIGRETTFAKDIFNHEILENKIWKLCEQVHQDAKRLGKSGYTVTLKLKTNSFQTLTRSHTLRSPTLLANIMFDIACQNLDKIGKNSSYRLIGISLSNLADSQNADPLDFLEPQKITNQKIENAMDKIRDQFGIKSVFKGRSLKHEKAKNLKSPKK